MKILLVTPYISKKKTYSSFSLAAPTLPPLGLGYLATTLIQKGYEVRILDAILEKTTKQEFIDLLKKYKPDIVGLSAVTHQFSAACKLSDLIKRIDKNIITVPGGPHISNMPERAMTEAKNIDCGVWGGELTLLELVEKIEKKEPGILVGQKG